MDIPASESVTATVFNIQKFCTNDGPGIRTTVFLKGCHLRCRWCHNPEGLSPRPVLELLEHRCSRCRRCEAICLEGCHSFSEGVHSIDRHKCLQCGKCVAACPENALRFCGHTMSAGEVMKTVLADKTFYHLSGGGITISGGEPLLQPDFVAALCFLAKQEGLHVCVETSGAVPFRNIEMVLPYTDLFLFDVKETDRENHMNYTGISNDLPLENISKLDNIGAATLMRCPIIPSVNDQPRHFEALWALRESLVHCIGIQLMPYHSFGIGKSGRYGVENPCQFPVPTKEQIALWNALVGN